ncbi:MAG: glycosyltransferase, partial [Treponema sp.]|nr:glycosyltransferase [Treponema sp.]
AKKNPNEKFAISGKMLSGLVPQELEILKSLDNVILLGYVSDEQVKALMQKCTAFVFPSYYEGFGIPPLEALSCGTKIIVSNAASLPEIYENTAYYINPDDTNINLKLLLSKEVESSDKILERYQYKNAAITLCNLLKKFLQ